MIPTCERLISWRGKSKGHLNRGCAARCRSGGRCQVTVRTELLLCGPKTADWAFQLRRPHILGRFISRATAMASRASSISSASHLPPSLISAPPPRPFRPGQKIPFHAGTLQLPLAIRRLSGLSFAEIIRIRASWAAHICRIATFRAFCFSRRRTRWRASAGDTLGGPAMASRNPFAGR